MDKLFGLDSVCSHDKNLELLMTINDPTRLAIVSSILNSEKIPFVTRERGSGGAVKVLAGFSVFGTDVFVLKDNIDEARSLFAIQKDDEESK